MLLIFALIKQEAFKVYKRKENSVNNLIADVQFSYNLYLERLQGAREKGVNLEEKIWDETLDYLENDLRFSTRTAFK